MKYKNRKEKWEENNSFDCFRTGAGMEDPEGMYPTQGIVGTATVSDIHHR